jgi:uncharacterized protein YutE (UPF0331/DUF86 family)
VDQDLLIGKFGSIGRACGRARDEYGQDPTTFVSDVTRQDAATLNVLRAWEALVEMGDHVLASLGLDLADDERQVIALLAEHGCIDGAVAAELERIGEFCRAEQDLQAGPLPALVTIVKRGLDDIEVAAQALVARAAVPAP